jgi:S-disulfanyl-L-cysteine oxidoreductase SoxD
MTKAVHALAIGMLLIAPLGILANAGDAGSAPTKAEGVFTRAQAIRGRDQYAQHCAACHADNLAGIGPALPLAGGAFQSKWASQTMFDFYERVRTTMPQNAPASLDDGVYADIVAFILRANNFPTGPAELVGRSPTLKQTPMTGGKP